MTDCLPMDQSYHDIMHYLDRLFIFLFIAASYTPWFNLMRKQLDLICLNVDEKLMTILQKGIDFEKVFFDDIQM
ncbi:hypothetical protein ACTXT7_014499 [Hymenolepis weldensis]